MFRHVLTRVSPSPCIRLCTANVVDMPCHIPPSPQQPLRVYPVLYPRSLDAELAREGDSVLHQLSLLASAPADLGIGRDG